MPGLAAKDVIDIQVTVAALADVPAQVPGFEEVPGLADHPPPGFAGAGQELAKRFFRAAPDRRPAHVHVREAGPLQPALSAAVPRLPARHTRPRRRPTRR